MFTYMNLVLLVALLPLVVSIPIDNGIEGDPEIICGPTSIKVVFQTRNNWEGKLYTKNFYNVENCRVNSQIHYIFTEFMHMHTVNN